MTLAEHGELRVLKKKPLTVGGLLVLLAVAVRVGLPKLLGGPRIPGSAIPIVDSRRRIVGTITAADLATTLPL